MPKRRGDLVLLGRWHAGLGEVAAPLAHSMAGMSKAAWRFANLARHSTPASSRIEALGRAPPQGVRGCVANAADEGGPVCRKQPFRAHRFAIGSHRARRSKALGRSALDEIPGIGAARKRALLHHFGSARGVAQAGLADLEAVAGISRTVARRIYEHFHANG